MSERNDTANSPTGAIPTAAGSSPFAHEHHSQRTDAHAVVIGINQYHDPQIPPLQFARADAEAMYKVLVDPDVGRFRPENVLLLIDEQATERRIRSAIGTHLPRRAEPDDTVFVFFAGHGAPVVDQRHHSSDGLEKYLIPYDAIADDLRASAVSMMAIPEFFDRIHARQIVFFIDSCYSGGAGGRSFDTPGFQRRGATLSDEFLDALAAEGRFIVTACATNEVSLEVSELGHGIFTHHLIEGLMGAADADGNGIITINELYEYVFRKVTRHSRSIGGCMNPISKGSARGVVYLTQPETPAKRRLREIHHAAAAAFQKGDVDDAERLWQEALTLNPDEAAARDGLANIAYLRRELQQREMEEDRKRIKTLRRRLQALARHHQTTGGLSTLEFARAADLLHSEPAELSKKDRRIRALLVKLVEGGINMQRYLRAVSAVEQARSNVTPLDRWWEVPPPHPTTEGVKFAPTADNSQPPKEPGLSPPTADL